MQYSLIPVFDRFAASVSCDTLIDCTRGTEPTETPKAQEPADPAVVKPCRKRRNRKLQSN